MDNYNYPCGADDRHAPWNQKDVTECDECGNNAEDELIQEVHGELWLCESCAGLVICSKCCHFYYAADVNDGYCVDCGEVV